LDKPDLDAVFMAPPGDAPPALPEDVAPGEEDTESDDTLNLAIDDIFASEDPVARREAFKRACSLCKEGGY
jgi:hypothetical protein